MRNREDKKCKKGQESTIGKIIYGFLLFMPLLAIGVTCGYAMFNKNAYQSYADYETAQEIQLTSYTQLEENKDYFITYNQNQTGTSGYYIYNTTNADFTLATGRYGNAFRFLMLQNGLLIYCYDYDLDTDTPTQVGNSNYVNNFDTFTLNLKAYRPNYSTYDLGVNVNTYLLVNGKVSDVFYYSVDKVSESPLFNWAENSIIYTTTNATCNALSITTPFIPLLLSYWLIISVIYFLYDIALMLVWLIHRKIHELQESL